MTDMDITPFLFEGESLVRVIARGDAPWFVAADVCRVLGIKQPTRAVEPLDDDEKGVSSIHTPGGVQAALVVTEGGLYTLVLRCRDAMKPGSTAHRFRKWVTQEVLPAIRRTGSYGQVGGATVIPPINDEVRDVSLNLRMVTETRQTWGNKAAQQMWFKVGLPTVAAMFESPAQPSLFGYTAVPAQAAE